MILQWLVERSSQNRNDVYHELKAGSRLLVLVALLVTALLQGRRSADLIALAAVAAHRILFDALSAPQTAVLAAAGVIIVEAFALAFFT